MGMMSIMRTSLATLAVVVAMLACGASDASAWVCRAGGVGVTTFGSSRSVVNAKIIALRRCERRSPLPVCTILYCR
jgi:hypothetical protein